MTKDFNVSVHRDGESQHIGKVQAASESEARCAALALFGVTDDEVLPYEEPNGNAIFPEEDFNVSPA